MAAQMIIKLLHHIIISFFFTLCGRVFFFSLSVFFSCLLSIFELEKQASLLITQLGLPCPELVAVGRGANLLSAQFVIRPPAIRLGWSAIRHFLKFKLFNIRNDKNDKTKQMLSAEFKYD